MGDFNIYHGHLSGVVVGVFEVFLLISASLVFCFVTGVKTLVS